MRVSADVVAEQLEPVGDAARAQHALEARRIAAADGAAAKAPQAERPEAEHDEVPLARQHAVGLAHHGERIGFEFEGVRQDHGVDRAIGNRQL